MNCFQKKNLPNNTKHRTLNDLIQKNLLKMWFKPVSRQIGRKMSGKHAKSFRMHSWSSSFKNTPRKQKTAILPDKLCQTMCVQELLYWRAAHEMVALDPPDRFAKEPTDTEPYAQTKKKNQNHQHLQAANMHTTSSISKAKWHLPKTGNSEQLLHS